MTRPLQMRHRVVIVGAGQAGLACSHELSRLGVAHIVLEKGQVANAWRSARWDSFCLVTPNWMLRLPGRRYEGGDADGFMPGPDFVRWLEDYAKSFAAPVSTGVEVRRIRSADGFFRLDTSSGLVEADNVVVATATYQSPRVPVQGAGLPASVDQVHAAHYRNPAQLATGAVLVVGSAQSGCQIAEELRGAGRTVYLATSSAGRLPRRYRGRDANEWQDRMGLLDRTPDMLDSPAARFRGDPHLTGTRGGRTLNLHAFAASGIRLLGKFAQAEGDVLRFNDDLAGNLRAADDFAARFCASVDEYVTRTGIAAPPADASNSDFGGPQTGVAPVAPRQVSLRESGISTVVWATGFRFDFSWIEAPCLDAFGYPEQARGVSAVPGLFFLGLNWMHKRKSGIIYGVGDDAEFLAPIIAGRALTNLSEPTHAST